LSVDILTQVHRSLPEMLPEPETNPGNIFENRWNDDYAGISTSSTPPITSTQSLEILVADRDYDEALRVLDALLEVGTEIPFSYAYESAALSAVKAPASDATEMDRQIKTFKKWFSLIPPVDQSRPRTFRRLRAHILLSPLNSLRLTMEFGLIAAEKGYVMQHFNATTVVCMYGDPSVTSQFIDELRRRYRIFLERTSKGGDVEYLDNRFRVDVVSVAVRTLARAGRFDHAVQLIPDPLETNFHLSPYTYNFLVHKMEMTKDSRYLPHIRFITQHKQETTFRSAKDGTSSEAVRQAESFSAEEIFMASSLSESGPPQRPGHDLAASLRALKKGFRAPTERPHPLTVVHFIEAYLASGRTRAIPLLRNFVLRRVTPGITTGSISYIFAEMLFHARCRNPDLVIQTFVTHFFIVGLPRDDLLQRMRAMERNPLTAALWECTPKMKIFPHPVHTAAVWRALLELTTDERALEALYAKLIRFANLRSEQSSAMHPGVPFLTPPPSWKTGVDASAFTPFIRRICSALGTERGGPILQDMIRLGIRPTIHQLTELAMAYSSAGEVRKTLVMLDQLEKSMEARKALIEAEATAHRAIRARLLPPVDSVFYVAVIRGFLLSNRVTAAKDVKKRMDKHFSYESGTSAHIDELEEDLRVAERGMFICFRATRISY
ncbi:hypothetical protein C8R47DRAFT_989032, partial [Mycena vitilis]